MSNNFENEIRQRRMNADRLTADIRVVEQDISAIKERIEFTKNNIRKRLLEDQRRSSGSADGKECFFCAETIRHAAKVCKFCLRCQPEYLATVTEAELKLRRMFETRLTQK
jgi:hypothetical protein